MALKPLQKVSGGWMVEDNDLKVTRFASNDEVRRAVSQQVGSTIKNVGKAIIQGSARSGGSLAMSLLGKKEFQPTEGTPERKVKDVIFGAEPLQDVPGYGKTTLQSFGLNKLANTPLVPTLVGGGLVALDFTTGGKGDDIVKFIAKSKSAEKIAKALKSVGFADDLIESLAPKLTKITNVDEVRKTLQNSMPVPKPNVVDPLLTEARKYKSAEEFVKTRGEPLYHGTTKENARAIEAGGFKRGRSEYAPDSYKSEPVFLTKNKTDAQIFAREDGVILEVYPEKGVAKLGPDKIDFEVSDPTKLKTKSQLTDIWKKAQEVPVSKPMEVPKPLGIPPRPLDAPPMPPDIPMGRGGIQPPLLNFFKWKDKGVFSLARETMERNLEDVAGADYKKVKQFIVDPIRENETKRIGFLNKIRQETNEFIVKQLGIRKGSVEDKLVQQYGEGFIDASQVSPKIIKAAEYFRSKYDELLDIVNATRKKYGYDPIPKRQKYFRHFQQISNFMENVSFVFRSKELPTEIAAMAQYFKPGKPFTTAELRRVTNKTSFSAIGGLDDYIESVSKQIFHTESVQRGRTLQKYIQQLPKDISGKSAISNFSKNLEEYTNIMSGKQSSIDNAFTNNIFGRKFLTTTTMLRQRIAGNMINANVSSALTNYIPFTQLLATTKKSQAFRGILESSISPFLKDATAVDGMKSAFLTRRFPIGQIDFTKSEKAKDLAGWLFKTIDNFTARSIVLSKYYEGIGAGMPKAEALKYADEMAGKIITDRTFGQLPNLFGSKAVGWLTQFQTEVNNMTSFLTKDIPRQYKGSVPKIANAIAQFSIYSFLFNEAYQRATGRRVSVDPIYYAMALGGVTRDTKDEEFIERLKTVVEEVSGQLPFTGSIVSGRYPISAGFPDVGGIIKGTANPLKELKKPLFYLGMPFGGGQLKKTIEGAGTYAKGRTKIGQKRIKIEQNTANLLRAILFGKYALPEIVKYYEKRY